MAVAQPVRVGRYALHAIMGRGGMAQIHVGRLIGPAGFGKIVAIKRLLPHMAQDEEFRTMLLDEARLASRIEHPNVVTTLDVVAEDEELFIVMEYVRGVSVAELLQRLRQRDDEPARVPIPIAAAIVDGMLQGLHAAHEARAPDGTPLGTVHRDVSPQNVLVGIDGRARIADFGVAKASMRLQSTREGRMKGKLAYMAPEQFGSGGIDRRTDVHAAGVVLWEILTGQRLFTGDDPASVVGGILANRVPSVRSIRGDVETALEDVVSRATAIDPEWRYPSAAAMAEALRGASALASREEIGAWVSSVVPDRVAELDRYAAEVEASAADSSPGTSVSASAPRGPAEVKAASAAATAEFAWDAESDASGSVDEPVPIEETPPRSVFKTLGRISLVMIAASTAMAGGWVVSSKARSPLTPHEPSAPASAPAPAPSSEAPAAVDAPNAAVTAEASATTSVEHRDAPIDSIASAPLRPQPPRTTRPRAPTAGSNPLVTPRPNCDPPFTIDERGVKRFKRGCM
jgi:serine/threonine-protein kinase